MNDPGSSGADSGYEDLSRWLTGPGPREFYRGPVRIAEWFQGKYQLEAVLGYGHTSIVLKAVDTRLGRAVALKVWNDYSLGIEPSVLLKEGRLLAQLRHAHIVAVYDYGLDEATSRPWMALEFLGANTLLDSLRKRGSLVTELSELVRVGLQVAAIVDYLHNSAQLLQLDLKPGNLAFDEAACQVKMMDLGSAYVSASEYVQHLGTPGYIAPELFRQGLVTRAADVFSLGMLLLVLAGGRRGKNELEALQLEVLEKRRRSSFTSEVVTAAIPVDVGDEPTAFASLLDSMNRLDLSSSLRGVSLPVGFESLVLECTRMEPEQRPSAQNVWLQLKKMELPAARPRLPSVFLSHSHRDKARFVTRFAESLQSKGFAVWLDEWSLRVGEPFWERIAGAIESSDFVIIVLSENSVGSPAVAEELRTAQLENLARVKLLPVRIDPLEYSSIPSHLRSRHVFDFVGWEKPDVFYRRVDRLASDIIALFDAGNEKGS